MGTVTCKVRIFTRCISNPRYIRYGVCFTVFFILVFWVTERNTEVRVQSSKFVRKERFVEDFQRNSLQPYRILYWKPFNHVKQIDKERVCMEQCPVKCILTDNKSDIENVDLVNFHLTNLWTENWKINTKAIIKFPSYRRPDQIWLLTNLEPPPNLFGNLRVFNGIFNWTMWYRSDATVHLPYGFPTRLNASETVSMFKTMQTRNFYKEKSGEVTGVASNCKDSNRRYRFVKSLKKYLDVNMFGYCYNKICGDPLEHDSCDNVTSKYKFYLALENSRCKDYVTEKYWWSLKREHIPIVNWDLNSVNENIPIPGSYISVSDFRDVKSLANYIKHVSKNETLYNSYFQWKKRYKVTKSCTSCQACKALYEGRQRHRQVIVDLDGWVRADVCSKVEVS